MIKRLRSTLAKFNLASLALDTVVVILGILIAFQIDRWAEDRRDREKEQNYLVRLKDDLHIEVESMEAALQFAESRVADVRLLEQAVRNPSIALDQPGAVAAALETASWRSFPQINAYVYSELQSTGNLGLIRSESLRRALASHYSSIRHHERVGLDLTIQHHYDRLTAGILSTAELEEIERGAWNGATGSVTPARALEMLRELEEKQGALDLLPNIAQHHVFNQKVIEVARDRTREIIDLVDSLLEDVNAESEE